MKEHKQRLLAAYTPGSSRVSAMLGSFSVMMACRILWRSCGSAEFHILSRQPS